MSSKKDGQIVIHLPKHLEMQFRALAEMEGESGSEKGLELVMAYLESHKKKFEAMKTVFGD